MANRRASIGVFDSGVGGLTVARQIMDRLPNESLTYLGDTARVPYGTKSAETVIRYALSCANILMKHDIKLLVAGCNTASAQALTALQDALDIPVVGVIEPGARVAVKQTRNGRIGVISTQGTMESREYERAIGAIAPEVEVFARSCPLFVPLAEEGWVSGEVPRRIADTYLKDLLDYDVDTLVLGCTHYPLLNKVIDEAMNGSVALVDSAEATAGVVAEIVDAMEIAADNSHTPKHHFLVSDSPLKFAEMGQNFLGREIESVEWVDF